ncbi:hypothetical protein Prum_019370 [Phytohabitans rumicis]|uniref:Uncharacterized protein n=1 Tax=Phytohabitans rumicis TaxID=1076125 RepID=A0A6V8L6L2_9ACTN|nr:hypothetical protein Prum_019370 [Phytohabitans rumicis]
MWEWAALSVLRPLGWAPASGCRWARCARAWIFGVATQSPRNSVGRRVDSLRPAGDPRRRTDNLPSSRPEHSPQAGVATRTEQSDRWKQPYDPPTSTRQ